MGSEAPVTAGSSTGGTRETIAKATSSGTFPKPMRRSTTDVLVVGAGPTGLLLAAELGRRGVNCRIVEQATVRRTAPKAINLHTRTLEVLDDLDAADEAVCLGNRVYRLNSYVVSGTRSDRIRPIAQVDLSQLDSRFPFTLTLPQPETERLIEQRCAAYGVQVEWGTRFTGLSAGAESVIAHLERDDLSETVESAWLVGCDGIDSEVRKALNLPFHGRQYPDDLLCADVSVDWDRPHDQAHVFLSRHGTLRFMPLPGPRRWRLVADVPIGFDQAGQPDIHVGQLQDLVDSRGAGGALDEITWGSYFNIYRYFTTKYRVGRIVIAGDAAHVHSPLGAQGMNIGLQDAYNLAWKLSLAVHGVCRADLLDSYEEERRPIAATVLRRTDRNTRLIGVRGTLGRAVRNTSGRLLLQLPAAQRRVARSGAQLRMNYRGSRLVADDTGLLRRKLSHGPAPGVRAPDTEFGPANHRRRCHDLLRGTEHVLLLFAGIRGAWLRTELLEFARSVQSSYAGIIRASVVTTTADPSPSGPASNSVVLDPDGELHRCWHANAGCLYLVRPDGYVGYRAAPANMTALTRYLETFFRSADGDDSGEDRHRVEDQRAASALESTEGRRLWIIQLLAESGWPWLPVNWHDIRAALGRTGRNSGIGGGP